MKNLLIFKYRFFLYLIPLLAISCDKDRSSDELSEELYTVNFQFSGFSVDRQPLKHAVKMTNKLASLSTGVQSQTQGYLYYWSFNQESLEPDIRVPSSESPQITYNGGQVPQGFPVSDFSFDGYVGGRAVTFSGASEVLIKFPLLHVHEVSTLGLDIGSSATGPKDFEVWYSLDGQDFDVIQPINQFATSTANAKNSFTYGLEDKDIQGDALWIKFVMKAGDRMGGSNYNPTQGAFRIDNLYLKGSYEAAASTDVSKFHYFVQHQDRSEIFEEGVFEEADLDRFSLQLPLGRYHVFFLSNRSGMDVLMPTSASWNTLYASNYFVNSQADIYGTVDEMHITQATDLSFVIQRMYSQIKFEFTDDDLSLAQRIEVRQLHAPFFFVPSQEVMSNPVSDQTVAVFDNVSLANKHIVFNQYMGLVPESRDLSYQLDVYAQDDQLIRSLQVASSTKSNMQLVFRGELLKDVTTGSGFSIVKDESWGGTISEDF